MNKWAWLAGILTFLGLGFLVRDNGVKSQKLKTQEQERKNHEKGRDIARKVEGETFTMDATDATNRLNKLR
jgi:hypothetical protein